MTGGTTFKIGDRVVANPDTWRPSEFDGWGAGMGVGVVVEPPWDDVGPDGVFKGHEDDAPCVDVRWPKGRAFQRCDELMPVPEGFVAHEFEYMDHVGICQTDPTTGQLFGRVLGIVDTVTFRGATPAEAELAFEDAVEDYIAMKAVEMEGDENEARPAGERARLTWEEYNR